MVAQILIPVSPGELLDKITILEHKATQITDPQARGFVTQELDALQLVRRNTVPDTPEIAKLTQTLAEINAHLWWIEEDIRVLESRKDFGTAFIELARAVYQTNDQRAAVKRDVNKLLGSAIREVKSYV